jgi:protein-S-isoprenylcysteine O-methyltransferase Ste14
MGTNPAVAQNVGQSSLLSFNRVLGLPWLDRSIAIIACAPILYLAYLRYEHWHLGIPLIAATFQSLLLIATMMIRRPPVRVTPNPLYWLLAFVATYWPLLTLSFIQQGRPLMATWITDSLSIVGLLITIWARISLGRNIGFVPAQRQLVTTGAYAYMRHPVYTGGLFLLPSFMLRAYTPRNAVLLMLGLFWFIPVKSLVEENFLRADPQYAEYMRKVRARWIPFVI